MIQREEASQGIWFFFSAMTTQMWILLAITGVVCGIVVWIYEMGMQALNHNTRSISHVVWATVGRTVEMRDYRLTSNAANVTAFAWSFLVFILFALYTANLTANLTVANIEAQRGIRGVADLPGVVVGSPTFVADLILPKYNIKAVPFNQASEADDIAMINALTNGTIKALVSDAVILRSKDAQNCGTVIVGTEFDISDSGPLFPAGTPRETVDAYDLALLELQLGGAFQQAVDFFITPVPAACKTLGIESNIMQVTWGEAAGLWIILGVAVGIGLLLVGKHWLMKWAVPRLRKQAWFYRCCPCANPRSVLAINFQKALDIGGGLTVAQGGSWGQWVPGSGTSKVYIDGDIEDGGRAAHSPISPESAGIKPERSDVHLLILEELRTRAANTDAAQRAILEELTRMQGRNAAMDARGALPAGASG